MSWTIESSFLLRQTCYRQLSLRTASQASSPPPGKVSDRVTGYITLPDFITRWVDASRSKITAGT